MSSSQTHSVALISLSLLLFLLSATAATTKPGRREFAKTTAHHPYKAEKLTHFRVYWHDIQSGAHPSSVPIIKAPPAKANSSAPSFFGQINMIDNPLTESPEVTSKLVGRSQGLYGVASQTEVGLLMAMNFAFMEGKYNGSSITVLGRNMVFHKVREMPVVGGSGLFRFARGYVEARTHSVDFNTGDAVVEYHCYVLHF